VVETSLLARWSVASHQPTATTTPLDNAHERDPTVATPANADGGAVSRGFAVLRLIRRFPRPSEYRRRSAAGSPLVAPRAAQLRFGVLSIGHEVFPVIVRQLTFVWCRAAYGGFNQTIRRGVH